MRDREWSTGGAHVGQFVRIREEDFSRVGHCWMRGRLLVADIAMVHRHAGDAFWDYLLVAGGNTWIKTPKGERHGYALIPESRFGAYVLGAPFEIQPSEREYHLLLAGMGTDFPWVALDADDAKPSWEKRT